MIRNIIKNSAIVTLGILALTSLLNAVEMENVYINGFISQGYLKSSANRFSGDTDDGTWEFNEAAISVKALLADNLSAGLQIMSRDFGILGNNKVKIDWAFLDYRVSDAVGFRIGKFKKPDGLYNTIRDADAVRTSILLPQGIYNERLRDINIAVQGIGIYGFLDSDSIGSLDYNIFLGNQPIDKEESIIRDGLMGGFFGIAQGGSAEFKYSTGVQLFWNTPITGLRFGQSFNAASIEINGTNVAFPWFASDIVEETLEVPMKRISSLEYQTEKFTFTAEYMYQKMEADNAAIGGVITPYGFPSGGYYEIEWESYYVQLNYQLNEKLQLGTYYSSYTEDTSIRLFAPQEGDDRLNDWAISAKYAVNDWWLIKAEVHFMDGLLNTQLDETGTPEKNWQLFAVKSTISF